MSDTPLASKPDKVQAIAIMTLVNGILNVLWGLGATFGVVVGTLGLGILCAPFTILPTVLGIFEIVGGAKLMNTPPRKFNVQTIAIFEIIAVAGGAGISLIIGILNLVFYNEPATREYIDSLPS
jgi:uncharacterized membrane protein